MRVSMGSGDAPPTMPPPGPPVLLALAPISGALPDRLAQTLDLFAPGRLRLLDVNPAFLARCGYTAASTRDLSLSHLDAADRADVDRFAGQPGAAGRVWRRRGGATGRIHAAAGTVRQAGSAVRLAMMRDEAGHPADVVPAAACEPTFQQLFSANPQPMWVYDTETLAFLEVNDAAVARYGYSREEFLRMGIAHIRPREDVPALLADVARTRGNDLRLSSQWRHRTRDGRILDVEITSHALHFKGRPARLVVAQDMTARVRAEAALRSSEAQLLALHAASVTLAAQRDPRMVLEQALQSAVTLLGAGSGTFYQWDAAAGLLRCAYNWRVPAIDTTPDQRPGEGLAGQAFVRREPLIVNDYLIWEHRMASGVTAGLRAALALPLIRSGAALGVAVVRAYDDAVRFTEADARLLGLFADQAAIALENAQLHADLERRVRERTVELEVANRELEAFAYSVSHDLRAPLRGVDGFSQALLEDYGDQLDRTARDYLARIRLGSQRMGRLIDDLLALSRVTRRPLRVEPLDLSALARAIAAELQQAEPDRRVAVTVADGLVARGDAGLVRVALENLMGNAWKFTGPRPDPRVEVGRAGAGAPAVYYVRDNGVGFDMAHAHKLFGAFQRLHSEREFPGTGIGLATVQRIIHRHGGDVWAAGTVGGGATFSFTLTGRPAAGAKGEIGGPR